MYNSCAKISLSIISSFCKSQENKTLNDNITNEFGYKLNILYIFKIGTYPYLYVSK